VRAVALAIILALAPACAFAADVYYIANGATQTINELGTCKKVTNNAGAEIMVPTGAANEWYTGGKSFIEHPPAGVTLAACGTCSWTKLTSLGTAAWYGSAVSADGTHLLLGQTESAQTSINGAVYYSSNGGTSWAKSNAPGDQYTYFTNFYDGVHAVTVGGYPYRTADGGATWTKANYGVLTHRGVVASNDGSKVIMETDLDSSFKYFYTSTNYGSSFTERTNANHKWQDVASNGAGTKAAAVIQGNNIFVSTNFGASSWTQETGSPNGSWSSITMSNDGTKLAATLASGGIYTSSDGGTTWALQSGAGSRTWNSIRMSADGSRIVATARGDYLYVSTDGGVTWSAQTDVGAPPYWGNASISADGKTILAPIEYSAISPYTNAYAWLGKCP